MILNKRRTTHRGLVQAALAGNRSSLAAGYAGFRNPRAASGRSTCQGLESAACGEPALRMGESD